MDAYLALREHEEASLSNEVSVQVVDAIQGLAGVLRPRRGQVARVNQNVEVRNFIGSVRLADGTILEVEPKVPTDSRWQDAVVQLLTDSSRISVTGSQRSSQGENRHDLTSVIAFEYERRLNRALRKDGPIQVFERQNHRSRRISAQLDIGAYTRTSWRDPTMFPVRRDELTIGNDFARGLSLVSRSFRRSVTDAALSARLRNLESEVIPGSALPSYLNPATATRRLPAQWSSFKPAWDIAAAVLRNRSIINDPGHYAGLEVAMEPWPLLETLLERTLDFIGRDFTSMLAPREKKNYAILESGGIAAGTVVPDGVLEYPDGRVAATFEAKYTRPGAQPKEDHRYQALSTAAVLRSPNSILVYPGNEKPKIYEVQGFGGKPSKLATIGLDLYGYRRDSGAESRAVQIMELLVAMDGA